MLPDNLGRFQLKKINPFQGLIIDADAWRDAHNYHRDHLRLHLLAFHQAGILEGLGVTAGSPPGMHMDVAPGIAVDPEGNVIVVPQAQRYRLQTQKPGVVYIVIQFREVACEPYQPPDGGQPTRLLDAYRIQERDALPSEPYLELARIDFDPAAGPIRDAMAHVVPGKNALDSRFRKTCSAVAVEKQPPAMQPETTGKPPMPKLVVGYCVLSGPDKALHRTGLQNLARKLGGQQGVAAVVEDVAPGQDLSGCSLLYLTGTGRFDIDAGHQESLGRFLQAGGVIFGEGCSGGQAEASSRAVRDFGLAFNQLAGQLKRKLESVKRGHPLLSALHVFAEIPPGCESGMLMEGGQMVYSGSDYGCAWQGGRDNGPLPREVIRASFEMGENIMAYARTRSVGR